MVDFVEHQNKNGLKFVINMYETKLNEQYFEPLSALRTRKSNRRERKQRV